MTDPVADGRSPARLSAVLGEAQRLGFIGPRAVTDHLNHAQGFGDAWEQSTGNRSFDGRALDLGSGGGLPGLVLAKRWSASQWTLLEASERRCQFLSSAIAQLGLGDRVEVVRGRAEEVGRDPERRSRYELVTARGFAPPAPTAECGCSFLVAGGQLIVSEPPVEEDPGDRWPLEGLATLGLGDRGVVVFGSRYRVLQAVRPIDGRFPRRVGVPERRPLF